MQAFSVSSGAFVALFPVGVAAFSDINSMGRRAGIQKSIMSLGASFQYSHVDLVSSRIAGALAGPPVSGAILDASLKSSGFKLVGVYAGALSSSFAV